MKNKKPNAEHLWKQLDDLVVPRLRLSVTERAVYSYLLRHSRLEGRPRLRFSIPWLARGVRLCPMTARCTLRRLFDLRVLRLVERNQVGHVVVVRLPQEIRALRPYLTAARGAARLPLAASIADADFFKNKALRQAIHSRERSLCFLLLAQPHRPRTHHRPCRPSRSVGAQFLPQPRFLLSRLQLEKGADPRRGLPPQPLPSAPPHRRRTHRPPPSPRHPHLRQAPPSSRSPRLPRASRGAFFARSRHRQPAPTQRPHVTSASVSSRANRFTVHSNYAIIKARALWISERRIHD
jgi:hypothetical protein